MKPFKILAIDGGGIKGLYSATVIARLEEKSGKLAGDCFDMVCGTSTGGLIALGIAAGMPAKELSELYSAHGNQIFPTSNYRLLRFFQTVIQILKQLFFWGKYSNKYLKLKLESIFGNKTLGDLNTLVCIPSFNLTSGSPRVFKYPHKEGDLFMDKDIPIVDAALATTAAPTYLPIHEYNDVMYIDGGVWANNPSLCGLLEALTYFVGIDKKYTHVEILSIASISQSSSWVSKSRKSRSLIGWKTKLLQSYMDGQAFFTDFFLKKALTRIDPTSVYVRIESPQLSIPQMKMLTMDRADNKAISTIKLLGDKEGYANALNDDVMHFFLTNKSYKTK